MNTEEQNALQTGSSSTSSFPAGTVVAYYGNSQSIPTGWFLCNGRELTTDEQSKYPALDRLLRSCNEDNLPYLPDLSGRTVIRLGTSDPTDPTKTKEWSLGQTGGEYEHELTDEEMPSHQHFGWGEYNGNNWGTSTLSVSRGYTGSNKTDTDNYLYGSTFAGGVYESGSTIDTQNTETTETSTTGKTQGTTTPHNNTQPYFVLCYMIYAG
jgi:microcystin-dependent protein